MVWRMKGLTILGRGERGWGRGSGRQAWGPPCAIRVHHASCIMRRASCVMCRVVWSHGAKLRASCGARDRRIATVVRMRRVYSCSPTYTHPHSMPCHTCSVKRVSSCLCCASQFRQKPEIVSIANGIATPIPKFFFKSQAVVIA